MITRSSRHQETPRVSGAQAKTAGQKTNVFLYYTTITDEQSTNEIKKTIPLTRASKRMKYLANKFNKSVEHTPKIRNIIKRGEKKSKDIYLCSMMRRLYIVKIVLMEKIQSSTLEDLALLSDP